MVSRCWDYETVSWHHYHRHYQPREVEGGEPLVANGLGLSEIDEARCSMTNHMMARDRSITRTPVTKNSVSAKQEIGIHLCCS